MKCKKCGSSRLIYKYDVENEYKGGILDTVFYIFFGIITFGLYFLFMHFAEKKRAKIEKEYYECQDCGMKMGKTAYMSQQEQALGEKQITEEKTEDEIEELKQIAQKETDMSTWKQERIDAVVKKLENNQNIQNNE